MKQGSALSLKNILAPRPTGKLSTIPNLPYLGKMTETAVAIQFQDFQAGASVLDLFQSSFHPGHGAKTILVTLTDDLRKHLDWGSLVVLLLLTCSQHSTQLTISY